MQCQCQRRVVPRPRSVALWMRHTFTILAAAAGWVFCASRAGGVIQRYAVPVMSGEGVAGPALGLAAALQMATGNDARANLCLQPSTLNERGFAWVYQASLVTATRSALCAAGWRWAVVMRQKSARGGAALSVLSNKALGSSGSVVARLVARRAGDDDAFCVSVWLNVGE